MGARLFPHSQQLSCLLICLLPAKPCVGSVQLWLPQLSVGSESQSGCEIECIWYRQNFQVLHVELLMSRECKVGSLSVSNALNFGGRQFVFLCNLRSESMRGSICRAELLSKFRSPFQDHWPLWSSGKTQVVFVPQALNVTAEIVTFFLQHTELAETSLSSHFMP